MEKPGEIGGVTSQGPRSLVRNEYLSGKYIMKIVGRRWCLHNGLFQHVENSRGITHRDDKQVNRFSGELLIRAKGR